MCVQDCASVYQVPVLFEEQNIMSLFDKRLKLKLASPSKPMSMMVKWKELAERLVYVKLNHRLHSTVDCLCQLYIYYVVYDVA